jgi:murein DD-endopeptidase MepM/ murein hydrolase activator NlpD
MTRAGRTRRTRVWPLAAIAASFFAGVLVDGYLRTYGPPIPDAVRSARDVGVGPTSTPSASPGRPAAAIGNAATATMGSIPHGKLRVPIDGANAESWKGAFDERRGGGTRGHEAVDILAPRNTPVHAVENGTIARIFESKQGGHTVYQFSADGRLVYYYAHLERYADGLHEGQAVAQGDVIGFVGTSGNAPPDTPHLHFAVFELGPDKRWWQGRPLDPYLVFKGAVATGN